ncbi:hypothetical protein LEP1GSC082_1312 [Leptospira kirschneri str. H2]|uniref:Uncharacterized protein n=3 Tax=Leptospira kirschneri TaxID=29507 RepID=A0A0E2BG73_9LEPT|nr:hypothetical protein LEP1GSC081_3903 [Leptospira kirschneri str. H1]EKO62159.1 hypothetical protein LEP1GSC082_1312 [Leptospira kirschneri str. H2]EMK24040.1 hypothetical protein LEP1GSC008_1169 [Leptospira kirschneri serovar Bulgarica str. Nikolaevo]
MIPTFYLLERMSGFFLLYLQKDFKMKKIISFFFVIFICAEMTAETKRGPLFFELTYGEGFNYLKTNTNKIDPNSMNRDFTYGNSEIFGYYAGGIGSTEDKLLSAYLFDQAPKPKITGQNSSFLFEYLIKSRFGIGLSLNQSQFQASNLSFSKFDFLLVAGFARLTDPSFQNVSFDQLTKLETTFPYFTYHNNELMEAMTFNVHFSYHFLENSTLDPYVRVLFGYGKDSVSNSKLFQTSLVIGSRYFITDRVYLLTELVGTNYDAYSKTYGNLKDLFNEKEKHIWSLQEYSAKFGIGLNW